MRNSFFLFIPLFLLGAGCATVTQPEPAADESDTETVVEKTLIDYKDEILGISFSYPESWGEISTYGEDNGAKLVHRALQFSGIQNGIIVAASKEAQTPGRGGYFGDQAKIFTSPEQTQAWCEEGHTSCESFTNKHGVEIWYAYTAVANVWGEELLEIDEYAIYHPDHPFYGLIVSNEKLVQNGFGRNKREIRALVDSLQFTQ